MIDIFIEDDIKRSERKLARLMREGAGPELLTWACEDLVTPMGEVMSPMVWEALGVIDSRTKYEEQENDERTDMG